MKYVTHRYIPGKESQPSTRIPQAISFQRMFGTNSVLKSIDCQFCSFLAALVGPVEVGVSSAET